MFSTARTRPKKAEIRAFWSVKPHPRRTLR